MLKKERKSFILFTDFADKFELLSLEDRGILISAVFDYVITGEEYAGDNMFVRLAFSFIRSALDRGMEAYDERCERNARNGKKGGRPQKNLEEETQNNPEKPRETQNNPEKPRETQKNPEEPRETLSKSKSNSNSNSDSNSDSKSDSNSKSDSDSESRSGSNSICGEAPPTPSFTPCEAPPTPYDSPSVLTPKQRENLISKGIDEAYIDERLQRAQEYAEKTDRSAFGVLMSWWESDRQNGSAYSFGTARPSYVPYQARSSPHVESEKERLGREAEEWFEMRLKQTFEGSQ